MKFSASDTFTTVYPSLSGRLSTLLAVLPPGYTFTLDSVFERVNEPPLPPLFTKVMVSPFE